MDATCAEIRTVKSTCLFAPDDVHTFTIRSYSGADIGVVCREALLRPIRRLGSATHFKRVRNFYCEIIHFFSNIKCLDC